MLAATMVPHAPPPYGPPPAPPPPQPASGAKIALVVAICIAAPLVLGAVVTLAIYFARVARHGAAASRATPSASSVALTQSYTTKNRLLTAHYPADFAVKNIDHATLFISKNLLDGTDEGVLLAAVDNPITNDLDEFARLLLQAMTKKVEAAGDTFTETQRGPSTCLGDIQGLRVEGTYLAGKRTAMHVDACFFFRGDRGYELKSVLPTGRPAEASVLRRILEATELAP